MDSACKELLSDAGLSFNEYGGITERHLACALPDLPHNALSENLVEIKEPLAQWPFYRRD